MALPLALAAAPAAVGTLGGIFGAGSAAGAAEGAAKDRQRAADDWQKWVEHQQTVALNNLQAMDSQQLARYQQALNQQERNIQRAERLVSSIDPALLEAGKQAEQLLKGQDAQVLDPIRNQRRMQRQELIDSLREQLGAGAETSQMGMNALRRFDADTSSQISQAQAGYTQQLLGTSLQFRGMQNLAGETAQLATLGQLLGEPGAKSAQLIQGFTSLGGQSMQARVGAAGAGHAGDLVRAQGMQSIGGGLTQLGGYALGGLMSNSNLGSILGGGGAPQGGTPAASPATRTDTFWGFMGDAPVSRRAAVGTYTA